MDQKLKLELLEISKDIYTHVTPRETATPSYKDYKDRIRLATQSVEQIYEQLLNKIK